MVAFSNDSTVFQKVEWGWEGAIESTHGTIASHKTCKAGPILSSYPTTTYFTEKQSNMHNINIKKGASESLFNG